MHYYYVSGPKIWTLDSICGILIQFSYSVSISVSVGELFNQLLGLSFQLSFSRIRKSQLYWVPSFDFPECLLKLSSFVMKLWLTQSNFIACSFKSNMERFPVNFFVCTIKEFYEFVLIILRTKQEFDKKNRKKKTIMFARLSFHRLMTDRVLISGFSFFSWLDCKENVCWKTITGCSWRHIQCSIPRRSVLNPHM